MEVLAILKVMQGLQVGLPALVNLITHYAQLKTDPRLSETDIEKMTANLQALELRDWKDL